MLKGLFHSWETEMRSYMFLYDICLISYNTEDGKRNYLPFLKIVHKNEKLFNN